MKNEFDNENLNGNVSEHEEKKTNRRIAIISLEIVVALVISFFGTYFITDRLTNPKYTQEDTEKMVYNNTKALDEDMLLVLKNEGVIEKEMNLSQFKEENSISSDISQQFLVNFFESTGYSLESLEDDKAVFAKKLETNVLLPNKYYIGEKDGYFAIYKTDNNGNPSIENGEDIYKNSRNINFLPEEDLMEIKNFKYYYDTKEEAIEKLTAYIS